MRRAHAVALLSALSVGCGAKTGLRVPDGGLDAGAPAVDAGPPVACVEVRVDGPAVTASLTVPVSLAVVDVMFLIDATGSMFDEIDNVRNRLRSTVVPGVRAVIPDAAFGVALFGEFPVRPHGPRDVLPYELRAPITTDVLQVEGALERVPSWANFDEPEAAVEGLFQVATGDGLAPWIGPALGCPGGGVGGACFRRDSLPIIMLITDAPMHNGPPDAGGEARYGFEGTDRAPHGYDETLFEVRRLGAIVLGLGARDPGSASPMPHLRAVARDTGAIDDGGDVLAFDIGATGARVGPGIVEAVERVAGGLPLDVDALVEDVGGDAIDARDLVREVRAVSAEPASGVRAVEADRFLGVVPGTRLTFEVVVDASSLPRSGSTRRVRARIIFRAFGRSRLGREDVVIVIPGDGDGGCDAEGSS